MYLEVLDRHESNLWHVNSLIIEVFLQDSIISKLSSHVEGLDLAGDAQYDSQGAGTVLRIPYAKSEQGSEADMGSTSSWSY